MRINRMTQTLSQTQTGRKAAAPAIISQSAADSKVIGASCSSSASKIITLSPSIVRVSGFPSTKPTLSREPGPMASFRFVAHWSAYLLHSNSKTVSCDECWPCVMCGALRAVILWTITAASHVVLSASERFSNPPNTQSGDIMLLSSSEARLPFGGGKNLHSQGGSEKTRSRS